MRTRVCASSAPNGSSMRSTGIEHIGARDGDPLLHSAGELMRERPLVALEVHQLDERARDPIARSALGTPLLRRPKSMLS